MRRRIPSFVFGLLYLLMIPAFAGVFTSFGDEFYHSTAQFEPYLKEDEQKILTDLRNSMAGTFERANGTRTLPIDILSVTWDQVGLYDLRCDGGYYSFAFQVDPRGAPRFGPSTALRLRFNFDWPHVLEDDRSVRMYALEAESAAVGDMMSELFPIDRRFSQEIQHPDLGFVVIDETLRQALLAWSAGHSGFPARSTGTYWRMLYLSAVTITTVGYGDILPISTRARLWVGAEAVAGAVVAGMFLNALAERARQR